MLWVAAILTFITGYQYYQRSLDYVKAEEAKKIKEVKGVVIDEPIVKTAAAKPAKTKKSAVKKTSAAKTNTKKTAAKKTVSKKVKA